MRQQWLVGGGKGGGSERDGDKSNADISKGANLASNLEEGPGSPVSQKVCVYTYYQKTCFFGLLKT